MIDNAQRLGIAAQWGYRSYESEKGSRFRLFSDLLHDLRNHSERPLVMLALESWDATRRDFESRFDVDTPILYTAASQVEGFRTIALARSLNKCFEKEDPDWGEKHSLSFMHFILGRTTKKHAFVVDIAGSGGSQDLGVAIRREEDRPPVLEVRLPRYRLDELRGRHSSLKEAFRKILLSFRADVPPARGDEPGIIQLSALLDPVAKYCSVGPRGDLSDMLHALHADIDLDLGNATAVIELARAVSGNGNLPETNPLVRESASFLRHAILQAVLVQDPDAIPVAVIMPDMCHTTPEFGSEQRPGSVVSGDIESSSLAIQFFPQDAFLVGKSDFDFWATMVSIVGRGKTIHDFSLLERERGHEDASKETIHRLKTDLSNLLTRLHPPLLPANALLPLAPEVLRNLEIVRQRLRLELAKVQTLYVYDRGRPTTLHAETAEKIMHTYDRWRAQLVEENSQNPLFRQVPPIKLCIPADTGCMTIPERFEDFCLEFIVNLVRHVDWQGNPPPRLSMRLKADDNKIVCLESEHCCSPETLGGLREAADKQGKVRTSGMFVVELFQDKVGLPFWSYSVTDTHARRVKLVYPIAFVANRDKEK